MRPLLAPLVLLSALPLLAQESASFELGEHTFNAGGHPSNGAVPISASFKVTLDAIGDSVAGHDATSDSYRIEGNFVAFYPPPDEVQGVSFTDPVTVIWTPERSVGDYNLYRDPLSNLPGLGFGACERQEIRENTTVVDDAHELDAGDGYFYLVTAENRLDEEGTKGSRSDGAERRGTVCP